MCRCENNFTCRACLDRAVERIDRSVVFAEPTTYYGTVAFGEILIHQEVK